MTNREAGERLVREAQGIFQRDLQAAWNERDYNLVVRRAQEVVEIGLKGALRVLGVDYPKVHAVGPVFVEQMRRKGGRIPEETLTDIQRISAWLAGARGPAFYQERVYAEADARRALSEAGFVLDEVRRALGASG